MPPRTIPSKPLYTLHKPLPTADKDSPSLFLVRRTTDGELFLGQPFDAPAAPTHADANPDPDSEKIRELVARGAGRAAANVLNHENLVSVRDELVDFPLTDSIGDGDAGGRGGSPRRMLLWDWCDAGGLQDVLDGYLRRGPPDVRAGAGAGFLPESLVWHVALGLLRALCWLHEGRREGYDVVPDGKGGEGGGGVARCRRVRGEATVQADWMPVLHRDVRAANVFLQRPRGIETYGAVKLGGFDRCFVSGTVSEARETPLVAMRDEDVSLVVLRVRFGRWRRDELAVPESQQPYTPGSELFSLGAILYRMMVSRELPADKECYICGCRHITDNLDAGHTACQHDCDEDVNLNEVFSALDCYTEELRALVTKLLRSNRTDARASDALDFAWSGFEKWTANTDDGRLYRDIFDDIWFRRQNLARIEKRQGGGGTLLL